MGDLKGCGSKMEVMIVWGVETGSYKEAIDPDLL